MPNAKRSRQQLTNIADELTYKLYRKQNTIQPNRYITRPATSYLKLYLQAKKPAQAMRTAARQQQYIEAEFTVANTTSRAKRAAFKQLANYNHLTNGSSSSGSKNLYSITCTIGNTNRAASTTAAGIKLVVPDIRVKNDKQTRGKQNHLSNPLKNLYTLGNVNPFYLTFYGMVINLSITSTPTKITKNDSANGLKQTQLSMGQQNKLSESLDNGTKLLPIDKQGENGIVTAVLAIARKQPH